MEIIMKIEMNLFKLMKDTEIKDISFFFFEENNFNILQKRKKIGTFCNFEGNK